jgi:hypothetical protein
MSELLSIIEGVADVMALARSKAYADAGLRAASLALDLVPIEHIRAHLDAEAARRAQAVADAAEAVKFK